MVSTRQQRGDAIADHPAAIPGRCCCCAVRAIVATAAAAAAAVTVAAAAADTTAAATAATVTARSWWRPVPVCASRDGLPRSSARLCRTFAMCHSDRAVRPAFPQCASVAACKSRPRLSFARARGTRP